MKQHLLIACGNEAVAERLESYFLHRGYEVSVATNGLEGAALMERVVPHLMVLDSGLP